MILDAGFWILEMQERADFHGENEEIRSLNEYYAIMIMSVRYWPESSIRHHFFKPTISNTSHHIN